MRIGILKADETPSPLLPKYGRYEKFYINLLGKHGFQFETYAVVNGDFPTSFEEADGWLVTGSQYAAYQSEQWIDRLKQFIRGTYEREVPLVGICFGHQVVASALGGIVERSREGWTAGPVRYERPSTGTAQNVLAWHQDEVTVRPPPAQVMGSSPGCRFAMLKYGRSVLTYQCHPELTSSFVQDLLTVHPGELSEEMVSNVMGARDELLENAALETEIVSLFRRDDAKS